jgi:hypothetical protein
LILYLLILLFSCTSVENNVDKSEKNTISNIHKIASEKFGSNYSLDYNRTKEFVICSTKKNSKVAGDSPINYFIYNNATNEIIESNTIVLGNISWLSDYDVKVDIHQGMIQRGMVSSSGYILNVKTNSKTKINGGVK